MEREAQAALQALMIRLADGDRAAFDPLFVLLWPLIHRFARQALNQAPEAEDAAQNGLLKVFSRAAEFDRERSALAWVLGIVAYECRTFRKQQARRREAGEASPSRRDESANPELATIDRELELAALQVLGTLRPIDMETLRAVMSGERPAMPAATFRKRVERAMSRLRAGWRSRHGEE